jgi:translation elongation factor EF-4
LGILLNGVVVEELSSIVHVTKARTMGRRMVLKLKEIIPRQMIHIAVQAVSNGKILAREDIKAYRKDVTAKLVQNWIDLGIRVVFFVCSMGAT